MRSRWSLRRAAGESRWQLAMHMARWLRLFLRQTRWLRSLEARETLRQAARADPRLYERWHRPYISTHFDLDTRRRIVGMHYAFLMRRFPAALRERIVMGQSACIASLPLEGASVAHVHLRKPTRGEAGELSLLLLTEDKEALASCVLTFDEADSVLIGAMQGAGPHTPSAATRGFIQGSHGLHPEALLVSLVRELAALHDLKHVRAVAASACVAGSSRGVASGNGDAFWQEHGGAPTEPGCLELPLSHVEPPCAEGSHSRREKRQRREMFRRETCAAFADAFRVPIAPPPGAASVTLRDAAAAVRHPPDETQRPPVRDGLLAAGL
jgi:uncharacterized protein VirK/YbjX